MFDIPNTRAREHFRFVKVSNFKRSKHFDLLISLLMGQQTLDTTVYSLHRSTLFKMKLCGKITIFSSIFINIFAFLCGGNIDEKTMVKRMHSYDSSRKFYEWYFATTRTLNVVNLIRKNTPREIAESHLDDLLISLGINQRNIQVSEVILNGNSRDYNRSWEVASASGIFQGRTRNTEESGEKLRTYADFNRGFILTTPSVHLAINYFHERERSRMFYQRDVCIVVLTDTKCTPQFLQTEIYQLLETAWKNHGLLNTIVQTSCHFSDRFFIYRPLDTHSGAYGRMEWYHQEVILKNPTVTLNTLKSLNNISLKVNLFYRYPTAVEVFKPFSPHVSTCYDVLGYSHSVGGVDGCTLGHLAKHLNFLTVIEDIKGQGIKRFGHMLPNGSFTGSLGDVVNRKTAIAMNGVFLEYKYAQFNVEFSQVTQSHKICPVVPKAGKIPAWISILKVFSMWSMISIAIVATIVCLFLDVFSLRSSGGLYYIFFRTLSMNSRNNFKYHMVLAVYLFVFHVVLAGIFNGNLFKIFSTISYYSDIDSLQDLADSDLPIETTLDILHDNPRESDLMRKLSRKVLRNYHESSPAIERAALYKNIVALERKEEAMFKINTKYLDQNGVPLLHVVDDCIMTHFISRILPEGSPFLLVFNIWFSRFEESGLSGKWLTSLAVPTKNQSVIGGVSSRLGLDKLILIFGILLVGLLLSAAAFIGEIIFHKVRVIVK